jgi:hypothetical protein
VDEREVLTEGLLDPTEGLVGDTWRSRGSSRTADGTAHPDMQQTPFAFVNSAVGRELNLRGVNAMVLVGGRVNVGDTVRKVNKSAATARPA